MGESFDGWVTMVTKYLLAPNYGYLQILFTLVTCKLCVKSLIEWLYLVYQQLKGLLKILMIFQIIVHVNIPQKVHVLKNWLIKKSV